MLDSIARETADEHARLLFKQQEDAITARINFLAAAEEGATHAAPQIVRGLEIDHPAMARLRSFAVTKLGVAAKYFDAAMRNERIRQNLGAVPRHTLEFVHLLAAHRCYAVHADGTVRTPEGEARLDRIMLAARVEADTLRLAYAAGNVNDAIQQWYDRAKTARRCEIVAAISAGLSHSDTEHVQAAFIELCHVCFDPRDAPAEFPAAVLLKFIYQVKRKMRGLPVSRHLMPVIVTHKQGAGKSEFAKRLLAPIWEMTAVVDFKIITDDRNIDLWSNYALFLDEMGKSTKADIEVVRQCITAEKLDCRPLHTNSLVKVQQNATFIGTANATGLSELIADPTGTRRFAMLTFSEKADWEATNAFDWEALWQSVDPTGPDPILPVLPLLEARQEAARDRTPVEVWIEGLTGARNGVLTCTELHAQFRDWENVHSPRTGTSKVVFGREMVRLDKAGKLPFIRTEGKNGTHFQWKKDDSIVRLDEHRPVAKAARGHI